MQTVGLRGVCCSIVITCVLACGDSGADSGGAGMAGSDAGLPEAGTGGGGGTGATLEAFTTCMCDACAAEHDDCVTNPVAGCQEIMDCYIQQSCEDGTDCYVGGKCTAVYDQFGATSAQTMRSNTLWKCFNAAGCSVPDPDPNSALPDCP